MSPAQFSIHIHKKKNKNGGFWYTSEKADYDYFTARLGDAQTPKQKQFTSIMRMKAMMDYGTKEAYAKGLLKNIDQKCLVFATLSYPHIFLFFSSRGL